MVKSKYCVLNNPSLSTNECKYDYGGYFIINGNEKVIVSQDRIAENKTYVFLNNKCNTYSHVAEIRSVNENKFSVPKTTTLKLSTKANQFGKHIRANIHHIKHDVPIVILFRALGIQNDKDIAKYVFQHEYDNETLLRGLVGSFEEGNNVLCKRDAYEYLSKYLIINRYNVKNQQIVKSKKLEIITEVLTNEFLPHCGPSFHKKAMFLGTMVSKLIKCSIGITPFDDRDSYINKRVDTPGVLIANLFRQYYGKMIKDAKNMISKDINNTSWKSGSKLLNLINNININKIFKSTTIESGLKYGFATGNWGIKTNKTKQGVAQVLNRLTYMATISHLRRIITPVEKAGKLVQPRKLHATQFGIICPAETPEGSSVGLVKNMSLLASITISSHSNTVREFLKKCDIEEFDGKNIDMFNKENTKVIVNGDILGITKNPVELHRYLKKLKLEGSINIYTGVHWDVFKNEIGICTEGGRCVRPLIRVEDGKSKLTQLYMQEANDNKHTWTHITQNVLEYLDVEEANLSLISMSDDQITQRNTHVETDPAFMLGVLAASIPFSNHNQSPRNCYQCLALHEEVLMANGSRKQIKYVEVGDEVVSFNPDTFKISYTRVINQYVRPAQNTVYDITTITGKTITATSNHPFMTLDGWKKVDDLFEGDMIGIYTNNISGFTKESDIRDANSITARVCGLLINNLVDGNRKIHFRNTCDLDMFLEDMKFINYTDKVEYVSSNEEVCVVTLTHSFFDIMQYMLTKHTPFWITEGTYNTRKEFISGLISYKNIVNKTYVQMNVSSSIIDIIDVGMILSDIGVTYDRYNTMDGSTIIMDVSNLTKHGISIVYDSYINNDIYINQEETKTSMLYGSLPSQDIMQQRKNMVFVPIGKKVVNSEIRLISDITVESDNHSFITTHGILSSNSSMGKQAIGVYTSNYRNRYDTIGHVLNYPQRPLVQTRMSRILNNDSLPCGMNCIVAIATYTGFNQEDSIMLNKAAIDRGMFVSTSYKTFKEQNNKNHSTGEEEFFCNPKEINAKNVKPYNYDKIGDCGFVKENTYVSQGDVIIGKCMPNKEESIIYNKDTSLVIKANENGVIDKNFVNTQNNANVNGDGYTFAKVRIRNTRIPCIGDKFSSRHGQKGTVGMIYNHEDMPFMKDGTVPDIIINPHAIPSRMTIAQLMECILGKACCVDGFMGDGSPFNEVSVEDIAQVLENHGIDRTGNEVMYNSRTGEQMNTLIFCGPTYYQRLKHMVNDKIHSRSSAGPVVLLTRQPAEGRARDGGLRLGEMEVECNWAHGISSFLKERFMECSDNYRIFVCKKCGMPATVNKEKNMYSCKPCRNKSHFAQIRIPYATKLMLQEVQTMSIATRYICGN